jgi:hypothetical protein
MAKQRAMAIALALSAVLSPRPADAAIWEWLEQLSGPGPFWGLAVEIPVICDRATTPPGDPRLDLGTTCWARITLEDGRQWERRWYVGAYVGRFSTDDNPLRYAAPPSDLGVVWWKFGPTFTWHAHDYFDLHTGIEFNRLSSKDDVFDPIWIPSIELMGITWRPFPDHAFGRLITFPMRASLLAGSLDATDFGAIPGTFEADREVQFRFGVAVDLWSVR